MILNMFVNRFSLRDSSRILRSLNVCDILFDYIYSHLIYIHHFFNFTPWPSTILKPIQSSPVSFVETALWTSVIAPPSENRGRCRIKNAPFEKTGRRKLVMRLQQKPFQKGILQILPECEHTHTHTIDSRPELMSKTMTHTDIYIYNIHTYYIYTPNFQGSSVVQKLTLTFCIDYSRCIHVLSCKGFGRSRMPSPRKKSSPQEFC